MNIKNEIQLYGFNNLTKSLSFSLYKLHYIDNKEQFLHYNEYIKSHYNSEKLTSLLNDICHAIGGSVLNIASQDYQPHGASVTLMISEEAQPTPLSAAYSESLVAHLDKSHLCVHTYPDELLVEQEEYSHQVESVQGHVAVFRADIELSTCGVISPLKVLNYIINAFAADVVDIDYRIRGMTRNLQGKMQFTDQKIEHISDYLSPQLLSNYHCENNNLAKQNLFHTRLCRKESALTDNIFSDKKQSLNHLLNSALEKLSSKEKQDINNYLYSEMKQLFHNTSA
jgi:S-adenosylmethionine decarboxylase